MRITAPTPVVTAQPSSAARSSGSDGSTATTAAAGTSVCSASVPAPIDGHTAPSALFGVRLAERMLEAHCGHKLRIAAQTVRAGSARDVPGEHDVVAGANGRHVGAHLGDDPRALVTRACTAAGPA